MASMTLGWLANPLIRRLGGVSVTAFADSLGRDHLHVKVAAALEAIGVPIDDKGLCPLLQEFDCLRAQIQTRLDVAHRIYPDSSELAGLGCTLLYLLCRFNRPDVVVETGVANGVSSLLILSALERNGTGRLVSIDVRNDVGGIVDRDERDRWELVILRGRSPRREFTRLVEGLPRGELFVHDSNHTYGWQRFELELASRWLLPGGLLVVDDADASYAFLAFCRDHGITGNALIAEGRVLGLVRN